MKSTDPTYLPRLRDEIEMQGCMEGTANFDRLYKLRLHEDCLERRGYSSCHQCAYSDDCEVRVNALRIKAAR